MTRGGAVGVKVAVLDTQLMYESFNLYSLSIHQPVPKLHQSRRAHIKSSLNFTADIVWHWHLYRQFLNAAEEKHENHTQPSAACQWPEALKLDVSTPSSSFPRIAWAKRLTLVVSWARIIAEFVEEDMLGRVVHITTIRRLYCYPLHDTPDTSVICGISLNFCGLLCTVQSSTQTREPCLYSLEYTACHDYSSQRESELDFLNDGQRGGYELSRGQVAL